MKFIIIHGAYGNSKENWQPWLKKELEKLNYKVIARDFPTPEGQTLENWMDVIKDIKIDKDDVLVGHSLGVGFILNLLERFKVKAVFLVAGFVGKLGIPRFDKINKTFTERKFNWEKIKQNTGKIFIHHSNNDPYVPLEKAEQLTAMLDADLKIINNAGHFNVKAGYTKFEVLLEDIKRIL